MERRAFISIEVDTGRELLKCWGIVTLTYPTSVEDIESAARWLTKTKGAPAKSSVIVTSMAWVGPATE